jgi:hypothetical protein
LPRKGRGEAIIDGGSHAIKATRGIVLPGVARHDLRSTGAALTRPSRFTVGPITSST